MGNCFRKNNTLNTNNRVNNIYEDFWSFRDDCCVCMENPVQAAIISCGHTVLCRRCAISLKNSTSNFFPIGKELLLG